MTSLIKKTLLGSLITIGALIALIFIFGSADPLMLAVAKQAPTIRFETLPKAPATLSHENITQEIAKQIAKEITAANPEGPQLTEDGQQIASIDPSLLAQKALEKAFSGLKIDDLRPVIESNALIIVKSSDSKLEEEYINSLRRILTTNFPGDLDINKADPMKTDFAAFDSAFNKSTTELLKTPVPYMLVSYHKDILSLLGALRNVFALIKNYERDPFQAALAIEAGDQFGAELTEIFDQVNTYAASHNLTIAY